MEDRKFKLWRDDIIEALRNDVHLVFDCLQELLVKHGHGIEEIENQRKLLEFFWLPDLRVLLPILHPNGSESYVSVHLRIDAPDNRGRSARVTCQACLGSVFPSDPGDGLRVAEVLREFCAWAVWAQDYFAKTTVPTIGTDWLDAAKVQASETPLLDERCGSMMSNLELKRAIIIESGC